MSEENKELTKEEKIKRAKELMKEMKDLELSEDELQAVSSGAYCFDGCGTREVCRMGEMP